MTRRDSSRAPRGCRYLAPAFWVLLGLLSGAVPALGATQNAAFDPAFRTDARFIVGEEVHTTVSALAWIEERPGWGAGYHWLMIGFYPFELTEQQTGEAAAGNYQPVEDKVTADYSSANYASHVRILLSIDADNRVLQVDMTLPGSTCTIAPFQPEVKKFLQDYVFEGGRLRLKSRGSFLCFANTQNAPGKTLQWDFDVDLPVFEFSNQ